MIRLVSVAVMVLEALLASQGHAASPSQTCQSAKNKLAGAYAHCREKAEAKFAITGDATRRIAALQSCSDRYNLKWPLTESKAGGAGDPCPSVGDQTAIRDVTDTYTNNVATALAGGMLQDCPADLMTCESTLVAAIGNLSTCQAAYSACQSAYSDCATAPHALRLRTEQMQCWNSTGALIACTGTRQDGEVQAGLPHGYTDNGDGTITDQRTGLVWEKLSSDGSIHDQDQSYVWDDAFAVKLAGLNAMAFAGHSNWRLPNVNELQSIVSYGATDPSVLPAFNTSCISGCTVLTCSCTSGPYWSSTTYEADHTFAWIVSFFDGLVGASDKSSNGFVRAVLGEPVSGS
jgi:hypothetical protein